MRVLLADDEAEMIRALRLVLEKNKYSVDAVGTGPEALDYIRRTVYDAVVLDIMMPGMDGLEVLRCARQEKIATPVMLLTARGGVGDRVAGLEAGADDYLPKPFAVSEFLARVRALCRRSGDYSDQLLTVGGTSLDCGRYELSACGGTTKLNNKEFQMMELFMRHPRVVFSTDRLMEKIWGLDAEADIDVVWTYIGFLRRKLRGLSSDVEIRTTRGAGYSLEEAGRDTDDLTNG